MAKTSNQNKLHLQRLNDIFLQYELETPISTEQLLYDLESLNNPYELIKYFGLMHAWIAQHYGDAIASKVMPEVSKIHAQISRPSLGGLTYAQLQTVLEDMQVMTEIPQDHLDACHARRDMAAFLSYVRDNDPSLTKTLRQINRKSVSEINTLMTEPQQVVRDYGKAVFTDRDEREFWHISFLRSLAQSEHMIYVRKGKLHLSKRGAGWLELDIATQTEVLFRAWCENGDWSFWNDYFYSVADVLRAERHMVYQAILAFDAYYGRVSDQKLDDICATLCNASNTPDEYGHHPFDHVSYNLFIRPLVYFGLALYKHKQENPFVKKDIMLTELGRWMLKKALQNP